MTIHDSNKLQRVRGISTSDVDELSSFQINKNRRYTQIYSGQLTGDYVEANLGELQVFRETLNAGSLIEAAPINSFIPFAAILSNADNLHYCGKKREQNTILQATGGYWDASFKDSLSFVVAAFHRDYFYQNIELRIQQEVPSNWLISKACFTDPIALKMYASTIDNILKLVKKTPDILLQENARRMMTESILCLILNILTNTTVEIEKPVSSSNKAMGIRRVIEYLHNYASQVPTIGELCKIAALSERNLQYAFKEHLGITPIKYLRLIRLNGVRKDLLISHPQKNKVVDIALNWGFIELGRFSGEYRQLFNELPSQTLKTI